VRQKRRGHKEVEMMKYKTMYRVEKFLPPACPKCRRKFAKEARERHKGDYARLLGDIVKGRKKVRETEGYNIIVCSHCGNFTARYPLEANQLSSNDRANRRIDEQDRVNQIEVTAVGSIEQ